VGNQRAWAKGVAGDMVLLGVSVLTAAAASGLGAGGNYRRLLMLCYN